MFSPARWRARLAFACALLAAGMATLAAAGELSRAQLERRFPPPLHVGERLPDVPAWPLTSELEPDSGPVGYVFESIDLAPIPGFEGTPFNLLIALGRDGQFIDVAVLRQHEPVFLSGLGLAPLHEFVQQYAGKDLRRGITVGSGYGQRGSPADGHAGVRLDGVTKATASVRIVNQTVLAAALTVARARLGFAADTRRRSPPAVPRADAGEPRLTPAELLAKGALARTLLTWRDADALFAGTGLADERPHPDPEATYATLFIAYLNAPLIGRSLLGDGRWASLMARRYHDQHLFWVGSAGPHVLFEPGFVPGTAPAGLRLLQDGLPLDLRDFGDDAVFPEALSGLNHGRILQIDAHAGFDPGRAAELQLLLRRQRGSILPEVVERAVSLAYAPPPELFVYPPLPQPEWLLAWRARVPELAVLALSLGGLVVLLLRPQWIGRHLRRVRSLWLLYILVFVGWFAQGQLSIVQLTGAVKTLAAGFDLSSFLYDPVSLLLIAVLPVSFVLWGRGPFCGWLCPFGALQEFVGLAARRLRIRQRRLSPRLAGALDRGRFILLAALLGAAAYAPAMAERLVEVEPFKTAITVGFQREWPYVAYALGLLAVGAVVYKFFCRYLCPLGAFMELGGLLRGRKWLARRPECGQPCQVCRHACRYDAIERRGGAIDYRRCHQCLDCVVLHDDPQRCVPLIRAQRAAAGVTSGLKPDSSPHRR